MISDQFEPLKMFSFRGNLHKRGFTEKNTLIFLSKTGVFKRVGGGRLLVFFTFFWGFVFPPFHIFILHGFDYISISICYFKVFVFNASVILFRIRDPLISIRLAHMS